MVLEYCHITVVLSPPGTPGDLHIQERADRDMTGDARSTEQYLSIDTPSIRVFSVTRRVHYWGQSSFSPHGESIRVLGTSCPR